MTWTYQQRLSHLLEHSMKHKGELVVDTLPRIARERGLKLSSHVLHGYYMPEIIDRGERVEPRELGGMFPWHEINELFASTNKRGLELEEAKLEGIIHHSTKYCCMSLWGFSLNETSKIWIPQYGHPSTMMQF